MRTVIHLTEQKGNVTATMQTLPVDVAELGTLAQQGGTTKLLYGYDECSPTEAIEDQAAWQLDRTKGIRQGYRTDGSKFYKPVRLEVNDIVAAFVRDAKLQRNGEVTGGRAVDVNEVNGWILASQNMEYISALGQAYAAAKAAGASGNKVIRDFATKFAADHANEIWPAQQPTA